MRDYLSNEDEEGGGEAPLPLPAITFKLDGEEFRCRTDMDGDTLLEWSELALAAAEDMPADSPEASAVFARFLRASFGGQEYQRLRRHFRAHKTRPAVVMSIIADIQDEMAATVREATGRPTVPPSPSSPGGGDLDAQRARVVSLARGEVQFVDPPPPRPVPADHKGKGGRPRRAASAG